MDNCQQALKLGFIKPTMWGGLDSQWGHFLSPRGATFDEDVPLLVASLFVFYCCTSLRIQYKSLDSQMLCLKALRKRQNAQPGYQSASSYKWIDVLLGARHGFVAQQVQGGVYLFISSKEATLSLQ